MSVNIFDIISQMTHRENEDTLSFLMRYSHKRTFDPGQNIVLEGSHSNTVYILLNGMIEIYRKDILGNIIVIAEMNEGDIFGEMGIFLDSRRSASIRSVTRVLVAEFSNANFVKALLEIPDMMYRLFKSFAQNIAKMNDKLNHVNELLILKSIAVHLIEQHEHSINLPASMTLCIPDFSQQIGIPYEQTFSAFQWMRKKGIITKFKIEINNRICFSIDKNELLELLKLNNLES